MRKLDFIVAVVLLTLFASSGNCQRQSFFVAPQTTDPNITTNLNSHYVSINRATVRRNQLFLFFPGTGGVAFNYLEINNTAADLGFHAINLTYPNDEPVNTLCGGLNSDLDCYANVRLETKDGTDRTDLVNVNRPNSIENRIAKLLIYLAQEFPDDEWGQFITSDSTIRWSKVVVSGHSQGGGYAGIIARYHPVVRAVKFAAMDFNGRSNAPANWIAQPESTPNATPSARFWGFSHQADEMISFMTLSTRIWPAYGMPEFGEVTNVDVGQPPYGGTHSLTSGRPCGNYHGCIVVDARLVRENGIPVYKPVWEYMLSHSTAPLNIESVSFFRGIHPVSRPAVGSSTKYFTLQIRGTGFEPGSVILINGMEVEPISVDAEEARFRLPAGKFGRFGGSTVQVRNVAGATSNVIFF